MALKLVFDIETASQYETLADAPEQYTSAWEYVSKSRWPELTPHTSYLDKAVLFPEFSKIVVISCLDSKTKNITSFNGLEFGGQNAEFILLKNFKDRIERGDWTGCIFMGHNIKNFDIPFIITRMLANEIHIPQAFKFFGKKPWEVTNVVDTRDVWKQGNYTTSQASNLPALCLTLGIDSPKDDIQGSEVSSTYWAGHGQDKLKETVERIQAYCEKDVRATAEIINKLVSFKAL